MTACAYRSLEPVLVQRIIELRERRERDTVLVDVARRVAARRIGRAVGGAVGAALGVTALLSAMVSFLAGPSQASFQTAATILLLAAWPLGVAAAAVGHWFARSLLSVDPASTLSGDPAVDLVALEAADPLRDTCAAAMRWERRSAALPLAAVSLLAPLTIHWFVWVLMSLPRITMQTAEEFGTWIGISGILVGHAHVALLVMAIRWTGKLRSTPTCALRDHLSRGWGPAFGVAVGAAAVPGIVLLGVPPILAAVTGLLFVPLMFIATARCIQQERFALEAT